MLRGMGQLLRYHLGVNIRRWDVMGLAVTIMVLHLLDFILTATALSSGVGHEASPVPAAGFASLGAGFVFTATTVALMALLAYVVAIPAKYGRWFLLAAAGILTIVVASNVAVLTMGHGLVG